MSTLAGDSFNDVQVTSFLDPLAAIGIDIKSRQITASDFSFSSRSSSFSASSFSSRSWRSPISVASDDAVEDDKELNIRALPRSLKDWATCAKESDVRNSDRLLNDHRSELRSELRLRGFDSWFEMSKDARLGLLLSAGID